MTRPSKYIIYSRPIVCENCKAVTHDKQVMLVDTSEQTQQVGLIQYKLPIGYSQLNKRTIPVCDLCFREFNNNNLPPPADEENLTRKMETVVIPTHKNKIIEPKLPKKSTDLSLDDFDL